jgi:hypothetical protein
MIEPLDRTGKWRTNSTTDVRAGDPKRQFPFPSTDGEIVPVVEHERRYTLSVREATNWRIKGPEERRRYWDCGRQHCMEK